MTSTTDGDGGSAPKVVEYRMQEDEELRFENESTDDVLLELVDGTAEVFGTELSMHKRYAFPPTSRVAVYTWHGCTLELVGDVQSAYVAKRTPMVIYMNTHAALEQLRQQAESLLLQQQEARGPRLMIVGPTDVGKSTYCRLLLNYAVRQGRSPTFVDLDVGQGSISIPGTLCAHSIERPADAIEGFERKAPLVFQFGHLSPGANVPLYNRLVERMADVVTKRCQSSAEANIGGVIINTCGWVKGAGYDCLAKAAESFEVDVVVVLDHERLYNELQRDLPPFVKILHQPKSGGVEERSREFRIAARRRQIRSVRRRRASAGGEGGALQYFYGGKSQPYYPHTFSLRFDEVQLLRVGAAELPDSCMPLGMKPDDHRTKVVAVQPSPQLLHHLLGVSLCESADEDITATNVAGFVHVTEVDVEQQTMSVLSPQPYPLPRSILVCTEITFLDDR